MTANPQQAKANYTVKSVATVVAGTDVKVRPFTLAPGEVIPWHDHGQSTDHYLVLAGALSIATREPTVAERSLTVGKSYKILPETPHLIANRGATDCRFLLVQGVGKYDWVAAE
jgi:quercetin dioxygenase-like cupin family protein